MGAFDPGFVEAYSISTKQKQTIPREWLDHPVLGKDFKLTPTGREQERIADGPSLDWTLKQLQDHADTLGVDHTGLRSKADVLTAITDAAVTQPPTDSPNGSQPEGENPTTPDTPA